MGLFNKKASAEVINDAARVTLVHEVDDDSSSAAKIKELPPTWSSVSRRARPQDPHAPRRGAAGDGGGERPGRLHQGFSKVMKPDAMLTAKVLSIANSPLYAPAKRSPISTAASCSSVSASSATSCIECGRGAHLPRRLAVSCGSTGSMESRWLHHASPAGRSGSARTPFLSGCCMTSGRSSSGRSSRPTRQGTRGATDGIAAQIHPHIGKLTCERWDLPASVQEVAGASPF